MSAPIVLAATRAAPATSTAASAAAAATADGDAFAGLLSALSGASAPAAGGKAGSHLPKLPGPSVEGADNGDADATDIAADATDIAAGDAATAAASAVAATLVLTSPTPVAAAVAPATSSEDPAVDVIKTRQGSPQQPLRPLDHGAGSRPASRPATPGAPDTYSAGAAVTTNAPTTLAKADSAPTAAHGPDASTVDLATTRPPPLIKTVHRSSQQPQPRVDHAEQLPSTSSQVPAGAAPVAMPAGAAAPVAVAPTTPQPASSALVDPQPALTDSLARLRSRGDGSHELSVQLHPAELGAVNVSATIRDGQLTVTVACADDAALAAVTAALPALHHQLSCAGFGGVDVHFGGPSQGHQQHDAPHSQRDAPHKQQAAHQMPDSHPDRDRSREPVSAQAARRSASQRALDRLL
jgi:flagellar hook-length control protein FliK